MSTKNPVKTQVGLDAIRVVWSNLTENDECASYGEADSDQLSQYDDRSVQVEGDFGGASIDICGSNDDAHYQVLSDPTGVALTITSARIRGLLEYVKAIKPVRTGGAATNLTITLLAKRKRK